MSDYQSIVDAEWRVIYDKLEKIVATGAKVVLSKVRRRPPVLAARSTPRVLRSHALVSSGSGREPRPLFSGRTPPPCVHYGLSRPQLAIGDLATQYFADRDIFCAGRVPEEDLQRTLKAVGGAMQTSVNGIQASHLGQCALFEERQIGGER